MWVFGNEYNYHWDGEWFKSKNEWMSILNTASKNAKILSPKKIVATVHGEIPSVREFNDYKKIKSLNLIMVNIYRGKSFENLFSAWKEKTSNVKKPIIISEFGRSSQTGSRIDTSTQQANTVKNLWNQIKYQLNKISAGGFIFELNDEAWKDQKEFSSIIGSEANLGLFKDKYNNPKKDAKKVVSILSKLWK